MKQSITLPACTIEGCTKAFYLLERPRLKSNVLDNSAVQGKSDGYYWQKSNPQIVRNDHYTCTLSTAPTEMVNVHQNSIFHGRLILSMFSPSRCKIIAIETRLSL